MHMLEMPWPPSANRYWRNVGPRVLISRAGRQYRKQITELALVCRWPRLGDQRLKVKIVALPPDRRKRDLDNLLKATFDALEAAGIFDNDEQVDDFRVIRGPRVRGGSLQVSICATGEARDGSRH